MLNSARSYHVLGEQSSVYIPISNIPAKNPGYITMESTSSWHVAALQAAGIESMTMSSRLRASKDGAGRLQDLEDAINSTGKRRIAKFEMSIADPDVLSNKTLDETATPQKTGSMMSNNNSEDGTALDDFDIDLFARDYRALSSRPRGKPHTFGRAEVLRGDWNYTEYGDGHDPHDRYRQGTAIQRYVCQVI